MDILSNIYSDTCAIIENARDKAYRAVNTALTIRNWMLGERIAREHLGDDGRAEYGRTIMVSLAEMLTKRYGKGFDFSSLYQYVKFYNHFPLLLDAVSPKCKTADNHPNEILDAVSPKSQKVDAVRPQVLPWTLYRELIRVENVDARNWYAQEAAREVWSSRTLHRNIASQYYFRLIQSHAKDKITEEMHKLTAPFQQDTLEFIKNPVVAEFLGLSTNADFTESELEGSIINHLQKFVKVSHLSPHKGRTDKRDRVPEGCLPAPEGRIQVITSQEP